MIKSIIKRIIIGVGVALALMFIKGNLLTVVNAKSVSTHKAPYESYTFNNTIGNFTTTIDTPFFQNLGVGNLYFNFSINKSSGNATFPISMIRSVVAFSGSTGYVCNIGTTSLSNSTYGGVVYTAQCPINLGSSGVTKIVYYTTDLQSNDLSIYRWVNEGYYSFESDSNVNVTVDTSSTTNAINNQTQTITNNQNQNTQDIIQNQNDLLGEKCKNIARDITYNSPTYKYGGVVSATYSLEAGKTYTISFDTTNTNLDIYRQTPENIGFTSITPYSRTCDGTRKYFTGIASSTSTYSNITILSRLSDTSSTPLVISNFMIEEGSSPSSYCAYGTATSSKLDTTNNNLNNINNTLNNSDTDQVQQDSDTAFLNFQLETHGLTRAITAPIRLFHALLGVSCNSLSIPLPFVNQQVTLPCMTTIYEQYFGSFFTLYRLITTGIIGYWVAINTFRKSKDFLDPNNDKIEVFNL